MFLLPTAIKTTNSVPFLRKGLVILLANLAQPESGVQPILASLLRQARWVAGLLPSIFLVLKISFQINLLGQVLAGQEWEWVAGR